MLKEIIWVFMGMILASFNVLYGIIWIISAAFFIIEMKKQRRKHGHS